MSHQNYSHRVNICHKKNDVDYIHEMKYLEDLETIIMVQKAPGCLIHSYNSVTITKKINDDFLLQAHTTTKKILLIIYS